MLASMYSGVSGMKAHQTRMNVIGNNIANVNTYGFKGSRATFRDVYYQTLKGSSGASASQGGGNSSQMGYGSQIGSIDVLQTRSTFTMTDKPTDTAIDGEGFFQVQDADGNIFYTRAGQLDFDSAGNLVDAQRRFVLGVSGNPLGKPSGSDKIQVSIPPVEPSEATVIETINGVKFTISASNKTKDGNVGFTFTTATETMTDGVRAVAKVNGSGSIDIILNPTAVFTSDTDLQNAVNEAIKIYMEGQSGKEHPAGEFTIKADPATAFAGGLTGKEICSTDYAVQSGKIPNFPTGLFGGFKPRSPAVTGAEFAGAGAVSDFELDYAMPVAPATTGVWTVSMNIGGVAYTGTIDANQSAGGYMKLQGPGGTKDYIEFARPSFAEINNIATGLTDGSDPTAVTNLALDPAIPAEQDLIDQLAALNATPAEKSKALGLSSKKIVLGGGTVGGPQDMNNLSGISIGQDGVITASHAVHGDIVVGRIDLVTFSNPGGLLQAGGTSFTTGPNSGKISYSAPGTEGSGALVSGSLELSNVDLSREFSDMITTQRGFQANSRLITVSDAMLEELVNLKR